MDNWPEQKNMILLISFIVFYVVYYISKTFKNSISFSTESQ